MIGQVKPTATSAAPQPGEAVPVGIETINEDEEEGKAPNPTTTSQNTMEVSWQPYC